MPPGGGLPGTAYWDETRGHPRTHSRDYISKLAGERLGVPRNELEEVEGDRVAWDSLLSQLLP